MNLLPKLHNIFSRSISATVRPYKGRFKPTRQALVLVSFLLLIYLESVFLSLKNTLFFRIIKKNYFRQKHNCVKFYLKNIRSIIYLC